MSFPRNLSRLAFFASTNIIRTYSFCEPWESLGKEHEECCGEVGACEELFNAADSKNASLMKDQTTIEATRAMVLQAGLASADETEASSVKSDAENSFGALEKLDFDIFEDAVPAAPGQNAHSKPPPRRAKQQVESDTEAPPRKHRRTPKIEPKIEPLVAEPTIGEKALAEAEQEPRHKPAHDSSSPEELSKKQKDIISKATTAFKKYADTFSNTSLFQSKQRRRSCESATKSLGNHSTQLCNIFHPSASALAVEINCWCDNVMERFDFIAELKSNPMNFISVTEDQMEILKGMNVSLLNNIILSIATECLKCLDVETTAEEGCVKFFRICACKKDVLDVNVALVLDAAAKVDPVLAGQSCSNFQQQLLSLWYDRLFRQKQADRFRALVRMNLASDCLCGCVLIFDYS